jgi:hypothetical protein
MYILWAALISLITVTSVHADEVPIFKISIESHLISHNLDTNILLKTVSMHLLTVDGCI